MNKSQNKILEIYFKKYDNEYIISNHKLISEKLFKYRETFGGRYLDHKTGRNIFQPYVKNQYKLYINLDNIKTEDYFQQYYYHIYDYNLNSFINLKKIVKNYIRILKINEIKNNIEI